MARHKTYSFPSRGQSLHAQKWWPDSGYPKAVLVAVHSWSSHSGRFAGLAEHLTRAGYAVYAFDFPGHGKSEGPRAHIDDFDHWVADLTTFIEVVHNELRSVPFFLLGAGVGGLATATYLSTHHNDVDGAIFNACALAEGENIKPLHRWLAWILGSLIPRLPVTQITSPQLLTRDPDEVTLLQRDELMWFGKMTAGTGKQLMLAIARIGKSLGNIQLPFLVQQGMADSLVSPACGEAIYHQGSGIDKTLKEYPGALHDLLHETIRETVYEDIRGWLDGRGAKRW